MKKKTIWTIALIMGFSFLALLYLQLNYISAMANMKKEQFDESVNRALYQASRNLELNETLRYLEKDISQTTRSRKDTVGGSDAHNYNVGANGNVYSSFELKTLTSKPSNMPKAMILHSDKNTLSEAKKSLQEAVKNRYVYQKALLDEVVYSILYSASDKPLKDRINFKLLDQDLKAELMNNGINIPYHFTVCTQDGREVYRCPDYTDEGEQYTYTQLLYRNDPQSKMGIVKIHFPDMSGYIFSSVRFMIPSIIFTLVLLVTFIFTIVVIFRSKRYSELKNDFSITLFVDYYGKNYSLFREVTEQWNTQLSLSKNIKSWFFELSVNNVLCPRSRTSTTRCDWINDASYSNRDNRNVFLLVSYSFNYKQKRHQANTKSNEIRRF